MDDPVGNEGEQVAADVGKEIDSRLMWFAELLITLAVGAIALSLTRSSLWMFPITVKFAILSLAGSIAAGFVSILAYFQSLYWNFHFLDHSRDKAHEKRMASWHGESREVIKSNCQDEQVLWKKRQRHLLIVQSFLFIVGGEIFVVMCIGQIS